MPDAVTALVRHRFAYEAALAVIGCQSPEVSATIAVLAPLAHSRQVRVLGRLERLGAWDAPLVTALSSGLGLAREQLARPDSGRTLDAARKTAAIAFRQATASALAVAQAVNADETQFYAAVALGTEIGVRIESALSPAVTDGGWQAGSVAGRLAPAIAAGRLFDLGIEQMVSLLGLSATQVSGWAAASAGEVTMAKLASDGVESAAFVAAGMRGPAAPLEGRRALAEVLTQGAHNLPAATAELGQRWQLIDVLDPGDSELSGVGQRLATVTLDTVASGWAALYDRLAETPAA